MEVADANDPGDLGRIGKYRGKPTPYGACDIRCTIKGRRKIAYLATHLKKHLASYRKQHATHIVYWILWRGTQGNMELRVPELTRLAAMRIPVAMDYIHMDD